jgi:penicillin-binding protein 1A
MENPIPPRKKRGRISAGLLALDAWLDSSLYELRFRAQQFWENATIFSRRFRVKGWRRAVIELAERRDSPSAPAASVLMLALAMPAFEETKGNWRNQATSPSPSSTATATRSASAASSSEDSVPIDEMPDHVIKAVLATEDRRFFEPFRHRFLGLARAMNENVRAGGVVQGGSTLTQQLAKNLFLTNERTVERKIKEAFLALWLEANLSKKEILQPLSRPRLYGRRHLRHCGGGGAILLRQERHGCEPCRIRHARRPVQGAGQIRAPRQPARRPRPRQRGADQSRAGRA